MFPSKKGTVTFMKSQTIKTLGGVMSAVALISGGAGVAQAATIEPAAAAPAAATTLAAADAADTAAVTGAGPNAEFTTTVEEVAGEEEGTAYVMACSCATTVAGGGAIANAEVEGVSLETLVQMACA